MYSRVTLRVPIFQRTNMTFAASLQTYPWLSVVPKKKKWGNPKSNETSSHDHFENVSPSKILEVPDEINRCCHLSEQTRTFQPTISISVFFIKECLKMRDPQATIGFNTTLWSNDLDDLGYPHDKTETSTLKHHHVQWFITVFINHFPHLEIHHFGRTCWKCPCWQMFLRIWIQPWKWVLQLVEICGKTRFF